MNDSKEGWLTPTRGIAIAIGVLLLGVGTVALMVIVPKVMQNHREKVGWLPEAEEVTAVRVEGSDSAGSFVEDLPVEASHDILRCLARRQPIAQGDSWKNKQYAPGVLKKHPDFYQVAHIKFTVHSMQRPVQIGITRQGIVQIGDQVFELPRDDFRTLQDIVFGRRNLLEVNESSAGNPRQE